jgi:apolipoprotein N-acyltransferase
MWEKFKNFDEMITPGIIRVLYWIGIVFVAFAGIIGILGSLVAGEIGGALVALFLVILGLLMVRVYCELIILGFKAVEYLRNINAKLNAQKTKDEFSDY